MLRKWLKRIAWASAIGLALLLLLIVAFFVLVNRAPKSYPALAHPFPPPATNAYARFGLDGFESPYLGHTGSWDGKGGGMGGGSKNKDLDKEIFMGLRWTFMPVHWRSLEPRGPVNLSNGLPSAWQELDEFVRQAQRRKLNILFQAPVIGGNATGPPKWAGRREPDKSAPLNMEAAAEFAARLATRYKPGGTLALSEGWGARYGVRAWEIDNEPEMYRTHWDGQGADYAEFATKVSVAIKRIDPLALIVLPGVASGKHKQQWLEDALNTEALRGSPIFVSNAVPFSIGPLADVVSFHVYEGMDSALSATPRTLEVTVGEVRDIFERWEDRIPRFPYARKSEYWHTEGNFDFIGALSEQRRANWRIQFFTRAFAAGVRKVCVMDASKLERLAIKAYIEALPRPFPMEPAENLSNGGAVTAFRHADPSHGDVWVLWAKAGTTGATVDVPVHHERVTLVNVDGTREEMITRAGKVKVQLLGDAKMSPPVLILEKTQPLR